MTDTPENPEYIESNKSIRGDITELGDEVRNTENVGSMSLQIPNFGKAFKQFREMFKYPVQLSQEEEKLLKASEDVIAEFRKKNGLNRLTNSELLSVLAQGATKEISDLNDAYQKFSKAALKREDTTTAEIRKEYNKFAKQWELKALAKAIEESNDKVKEGNVNAILQLSKLVTNNLLAENKGLKTFPLFWTISRIFKPLTYVKGDYATLGDRISDNGTITGRNLAAIGGGLAKIASGIYEFFEKQRYLHIENARARAQYALDNKFKDLKKDSLDLSYTDLAKIATRVKHAQRTVKNHKKKIEKYGGDVLFARDQKSQNQLLEKDSMEKAYEDFLKQDKEFILKRAGKIKEADLVDAKKAFQDRIDQQGGIMKALSRDPELKAQLDGFIKTTAVAAEKAAKAAADIQAAAEAKEKDCKKFKAFIESQGDIFNAHGKECALRDAEIVGYQKSREIFEKKNITNNRQSPEYLSELRKLAEAADKQKQNSRRISLRGDSSHFYR